MRKFALILKVKNNHHSNNQRCSTNSRSQTALLKTSFSIYSMSELENIQSARSSWSTRKADSELINPASFR